MDPSMVQNWQDSQPQFDEIPKRARERILASEAQCGQECPSPWPFLAKCLPLGPQPRGSFPQRGLLYGCQAEELLLFLQNLPTARWNDQDVSLLLAEAYRLKFAFADAPNHYKK
ncbi:TBC1 domain family member 22A [Cricetulus griseus]|uniref:TBC1 domain family member 22A n=1 Tax=Cricetulus griseus TaxID=10029 RepID=G3IIA6_CRIGR|nr:TBC1 domain family member 22A [Cricetulus griseus]